MCGSCWILVEIWGIDSLPATLDIVSCRCTLKKFGIRSTCLLTGIGIVSINVVVLSVETLRISGVVCGKMCFRLRDFDGMESVLILSGK